MKASMFKFIDPGAVAGTGLGEAGPMTGPGVVGPGTGCTRGEVPGKGLGTAGEYKDCMYFSISLNSLKASKEKPPTGGAVEVAGPGDTGASGTGVFAGIVGGVCLLFSFEGCTACLPD